MIEYLPWSSTELYKTFSSYKEKLFTVLDIELGGACNLSCVYCDTPDHKIRSQINVQDIERLFLSKKFKWLFICGLGEPLTKENKKQLLNILKQCEKFGVLCSMFTNLLELDEDICTFIENGVLHLLFKFDSLNPNTANKIYVTQSAKEIISNIRKLRKLVRVKDNLTNISASIVPTAINFSEIRKLLLYCKKNNFFPMIGDLENAGKAKNIFDKLKLSSEQLEEIKDIYLDINKEEYRIPICPSVVGGIHLNYMSQVTVDKKTGLSCHWFWLKEPDVAELIKFDSSVSYHQIRQKIIDYRIKCLENVVRLSAETKNLSLGGCGGDIKNLLAKYITIQWQMEK